LEKELNIKLKYHKLPPRISDQKVFVADISKIKQKLGWQPMVGKIAGIKKMLVWIKGEKR
jgi:CDP-paratose 2-epimerase